MTYLSLMIAIAIAKLFLRTTHDQKHASKVGSGSVSGRVVKDHEKRPDSIAPGILRCGSSQRCSLRVKFQPKRKELTYDKEACPSSVSSTNAVSLVDPIPVRRWTRCPIPLNLPVQPPSSTLTPTSASALTPTSASTSASTTSPISSGGVEKSHKKRPDSIAPGILRCGSSQRCSLRVKFHPKRKELAYNKEACPSSVSSTNAVSLVDPIPVRRWTRCPRPLNLPVQPPSSTLTPTSASTPTPVAASAPTFAVDEDGDAIMVDAFSPEDDAGAVTDDVTSMMQCMMEAMNKFEADNIIATSEDDASEATDDSNDGVVALSCGGLKRSESAGILSAVGSSRVRSAHARNVRTVVTRSMDKRTRSGRRY